MNKQNFKNLKDYIDKKINWNQDNCQGKLMELTVLYSKCIDLFSEESLLLNELKLQKDIIYGDLLETLKFESNRRWDSKNELESQMYREPKFQLISRQINEQQSVVDYLGKCFEIIKSTQYAIKSYMDWEKFKSGERI